MCAHRRLRSAWAFARSDQSSQPTWRKLGSLATHWAHCEDPDQTERMTRLILSLRWAHVIFLVLSGCGSYFWQDDLTLHNSYDKSKKDMLHKALLTWGKQLLKILKCVRPFFFFFFFVCLVYGFLQPEFWPFKKKICFCLFFSPPMCIPVKQNNKKNISN